MRSAKALEWVQGLKHEVGTFNHGVLENGLETLYISVKIDSRTICLTDIYLPESEQHQGFGTAIVSALERKAAEFKLDLVIGPLMGMEDEDGNEVNHLETILNKRNYRGIPPFCAKWTKANIAEYIK